MQKKTKPLSLAFIGGALDSAVGYTHFAASRMDNRWALAAGCFSRNMEKNLNTAHSYNISEDRAYKCWQEMLSSEKGKIDAVAVLTPTPSHYEIVTHCLREGIPVICEKALATTYQEASMIDDLCAEKNAFLAVTYNYSGYPMVRELRNLIRKGTLGKIIHFQVEMPQEGFIRLDSAGNKPTPQSWRLSDGEIPTIHLDLAVHLHHLIDYLTGAKPLEVSSNQASYGWFENIIDNVTSLCRYTDDIQGQIWFSKSAMGHRNGLKIRIYGTDASAEWYQMTPEEIVISTNNGYRQILDRASKVEITNQLRYNRFKSGHPAGFIEAFANLYSDIADCLQEYKLTGSWHSDEVFGASLAAEGLYFLEKMVLSSQTNRWEAVENIMSYAKPGR